MISDFTVEVERRGGGRVQIRYLVGAPPNKLKLSSATKPKRSDGLWKTTCFEAFAKAVGREGYVEYNFAPSGAWAVYDFIGYRDGMADLEVTMPPAIETAKHDNLYAVEASFELPDDLLFKDIQLAVTAVIEELDGTKSYWSLAHPSGAPDFHHPDCFTLNLPARAET